MSYLPQVCHRRRGLGYAAKLERERERAGERESDREGGTKGGREALEKLLSPPVIYLPVVCAGGLGKDEEWRRRRTRTGVSAVWSLDSTFCNMFC